MPKLKNKSGAKKRFRLSGSGKVIMSQAGKRHGMRKRPQKMIRNARGSSIMCEADAKIVRRNFLIYAK
ncbi:MAG: 50S ribosomal protein L35 [Kiloniellaceae bacterium]|jgi:large subunit ribosomal protein L35|nr:50S ribosomal protein L35 [Kiloniellaceae bacterium]